MKEHYRVMQSQVLSCKATVSEVIDAEAGIYLVSNNMKLYTTFLKDLTGELWSGGQAEESAESSVGSQCLEASSCRASSGHSSLYRCLALGDTVKILRCHYIHEEDKVVLCCGQSLIVNESSRKLVLRTCAAEAASWVTAAVHALNLGLKGLVWLLRLRDDLLTILPSHGPAKKTAAAGPHTVTSLLKEAERWNLRVRKPRSLLEEFLQPDHKCNCGLMQDLMPPFELATLNSILSAQAQNASLSASNQGCQVTGNRNIGLHQQGSQFCDFWSWSVSPKKKASSVLVGEIACGHGGVLQLVQRAAAAMDLIVIGDTTLVGCKFGSTVALVNYFVVKENFFVSEESGAGVEKLYIAVKGSDLFLLEGAKAEPSLAEESNRYRMKLLSKSALTFQRSKKVKDLPLSQLLDIKLFWGMTTIMKLGLKGEVLEKWQRFVKFSKDNADLYPLLEAGDECDLRIPPSLNPDIALKKCQTCQQMNCFSEHGCLFLPPEIRMTKVSSEKIRCGEVSVRQTKRNRHHSELITVSGTVLDQTFVSPNFRSETCELPLDVCNEFHIGVPQGMNLRLLLQDGNDPGSEIHLYVTCSTNFFIKAYPLFVIPGVRILATDVRRVVAKSSKNVYLSSSEVTRIIPLSVPESEQAWQADAASTFLEPVYCTLRNISCHTNTFVIFARINKIMAAAVRVFCKYCHEDLVEDSYCCENCFGSSYADVEVCLEISIDDGTDTAFILVKDMTHLTVLLGLSRKEQTKLYDVIVSECLHLHYSVTTSQSSKSKGRDSEDLKRMITQADLAHSYRFTCRKQDSPSLMFRCVTTEANAVLRIAFEV